MQFRELFSNYQLSQKANDGLWRQASPQPNEALGEKATPNSSNPDNLELLAAEVLGLSNDSRSCKSGWVFIANRGLQKDSHDYIPQVIASGCSALVVQDLSKVPYFFSGLVLQVEDARAAMDDLATRFYGRPSQELFCVGVTGTNGKTSTTYMLEHIFNLNQQLTGVIGTVNHHVGHTVWNTAMTTPDPIFLQQRLREFCEHKAKALAIEVSSHALDQKRVDGVDFDVAIFTNLTRDHLDYHQTMQHYFLSKQRLFSDLLARSKKPKTFAIINGDDEYGRKIQSASSSPVFYYGQQAHNDFKFTIKNMAFAETEFLLEAPWGQDRVRLPMSGIHNVYNAVGAMAAAYAWGLTPARICEALQSFSGVPGRLQRVLGSKNVYVFVDYAHTPDALENVLRSLKLVQTEHRLKNKIITVFGCGGDRDKGKRPQMAQVAEKYSDQVVVTSDNPRSENPKDIIQNILAGFSPEARAQVRVEEDRRAAIAKAISMAKDADVILIAGKGHEDYQIIGDQKIYFSDVEVAKEYLL